MVEGDMSATVLVPQCTLTDLEKLETEHAEDRGEPTREEETKARDQPISESHLRLNLALTARLHRIVGSGIFDEEGKTYLLQANDAALLPDPEAEVESSSSPAKAESSTTPVKAPVSSSSRSPVKPRRSKRLSEAPSDISIKEESSSTIHRGASMARTADPLVEEDADMTEGVTYNLRSKSEAPQSPNTNGEAAADVTAESDHETQRGDEVVVVPPSDRGRTATPTQKDEGEAHLSPARYSLRSKGPDPEDANTEIEETLTTSTRARRSKTRTITPSASAEPHSTNAITPMTTRRRARESVIGTEVAQSPAPTSSWDKGKQKAQADDNEPTSNDDEEKAAELVTPLKAKASSKKGKGRQDDPRYIPNERDGEESDTSSTYIIPNVNEALAGASSGTGKKKRKMGSISSRGNESPWQLDQQDRSEPVSPTASRKRRAVASKDQPDVPVPQNAKKEEPELAKPASGWRRFWPFNR